MAKAGEGFTFRCSLFKDGDIVNNPTLAAGDVVVVQDDDTVDNISALPTVVAGDNDVLNVTLSAAEMGGSAGDNVTVKFEDQAGAEWEPLVVDIPLTTRDVDDLAYPATSGRSIAVDASGRVDSDVQQIEGVDATNQIRDSILDDATRFSGADIAAILVDTGTAIPALIAALNDLSAADVMAQLNAYDSPTYTELLNFIQVIARSDAAINADLAAVIAAINNDEGSGAGDWTNLSDSLEAIADGSPSPLAVEWTYSVTEPDGVTPIQGVDVWVTTDVAGSNVVWRGMTDTFGAARDLTNSRHPWLDPGTYYFRRHKAGYNFPEYDTEVVS
jgi:hypothetical protein